MKKIELMIVVVAMVLLAACDDFIDTVPKGKVIPTTMDDFKSMIIDDSFQCCLSNGKCLFG